MYYESKKPYEYCYYNTTTLKNKVNYQIENKEQQRYFFKRRRASDFSATILDPEKVDEGLKIASNFAGSNIRRDKIAPFYLGPGKELPSQYDMRYMTKLTNHYRNRDDKLITSEIDYRVNKLKEVMINKRNESLKKSKRVSPKK